MPFQPGTPRRPRRPHPPSEHHHRTPVDPPADPPADSPAVGEHSGGSLLYTPEQAAARLQVRESWLRKKAAARAIPCTFLGRHLRFSPADLAAIVAAAAQPPNGRQPRPSPGSRRTRQSGSTPRDPDLIHTRIRSVHPPDPHDHNHPDGSSTWPG